MHASTLFSPDVQAGANAFITKPVRDLYIEELNYIKTQAAADTNLSAYFKPQTETAAHERAAYKRHMYAEGRTKVIAPRRYFAQEAVLGWCIFKAIESFFAEAEDMHQLELSTSTNPDPDSQADTSYEAYQNYLLRSLDWAKVVHTTWVMAFSLKTATEIHTMKEAGTLHEWIETCKTWYANSFMLTPWFGKSKEAYVIPYLQAELAKYEDLTLLKTSSERDRLYMIDFMIAEKGYTFKEGKASTTITPIQGISVKGLSWHHANQRGTSTYQSEGEKREKAGHARLQKDHGVTAVVLVSGFQQKNAELALVVDIRAILRNLENAGKITRIK